MKQQYFLCVVAIIMLLGITAGCTKGKSEKSKSILLDGEVVLISNEKNEDFLTLSATIQNNRSKETEPFYVGFKINDKWLISKLEGSTFTVGEEIIGNDGKLFTIRQKSGYKIGGTYKILSPVDEKKLKKVIEDDKAVEVLLLNQNKKEIMNSVIHNFGKKFD